MNSGRLDSGLGTMHSPTELWDLFSYFSFLNRRNVWNSKTSQQGLSVSHKGPVGLLVLKVKPVGKCKQTYKPFDIRQALLSILTICGF